MAEARRARRAQAAINLLSLVLAGAGLAMTVRLSHDRVLDFAPLATTGLLIAGFFVAFVLAELFPLHIELRREAYSFSLSGIALLMGVLLYDAHHVIAVRIAAAVVLFAVQRPAPIKALYNLSAYLFEASLIATVLPLVLGHAAPVDLRLALACYLVVSAVDLLMSALVLAVILLHSGRLSRAQIPGVVLPATMLCFFSTITTMAIVVLLHEGGSLAVLLLAGLAALGVGAYLSYLRLRRQHQSLAVVHDFVQQGAGAGGVDELVETLLVRTRQLLRGSHLELIVYDYYEMGDRLVEVDENDGFTDGPLPAAPDWLLSRAMDNHESIVVPRRTRDAGLRRWLRDRGARDAIVVPLPAPATRGAITITNRLGDTGTFTADDVTLLQTLAGHLTIATQGARLVEQLRHDATHDTLTGLGNRALLMERIEAATAQNAAYPDSSWAPDAAVLLLDLDKFKEVNDVLGHHVGDALLQAVGVQLQAQVDSGATVSRLGGDEFAVLLRGEDAPEEALRVAHRIEEALGHPITLLDAVVATRASIGIAVATRGLGATDLLRHADTAMYAAKQDEQSIVVYTEELDHGRSERLRLLADLHLALDRDEFSVLFQPQLDLKTNTVRSVEALTRWEHPSLGTISPETFIPLAESSGMIEQLTYLVLAKSLAQARKWQDDGLDIVVAVNLSPQNVNNARLAEDVAAALAHAGLPADRLVLEITESSVMGDPGRTVPILRRLADIGVTLSLDDFGTGYSSLAYLQKLPVSEVKIDKSFVMGLSEPAQAHASSVLIRSILTLSDNLGLRVVAEGVEDAQILEQLRDLGCDLVQGYHLAKPLEAERIPLIVARHEAQAQVPRQGKRLSSVSRAVS